MWDNNVGVAHWSPGPTFDAQIQDGCQASAIRLNAVPLWNPHGVFEDADVAIPQDLSNGMLDCIVSAETPAFQAATVGVIPPRIHPFLARRARRRPARAQEARGCHHLS